VVESWFQPTNTPVRTVENHGLFSQEVKEEVRRRANGHCETAWGWGCGQYLFEIPEYDHIWPWVYGGSNELSNCQLLCRSCNAKKGSQVPTWGGSTRDGRSRHEAIKAWVQAANALKDAQNAAFAKAVTPDENRQLKDASDQRLVKWRRHRKQIEQARKDGLYLPVTAIDCSCCTDLTALNTAYKVTQRVWRRALPDAASHRRCHDADV
jgi:hypothetical protein